MEEGQKSVRGNDFPTTEAGISVADSCRTHGVSDATVYKWKAKDGGMDVGEAKRLKGLEDENARLKRLLADAMLDNDALKDLRGKVVTPAAKRQAVAHLAARQWGRRFCRGQGRGQLLSTHSGCHGLEPFQAKRKKLPEQVRPRFRTGRHGLQKRKALANHTISESQSIQS